MAQTAASKKPARKTKALPKPAKQSTAPATARPGLAAIGRTAGWPLRAGRRAWGATAPLRRHIGVFFAVAGSVVVSQLALWWKPVAGVYANAALFAVLLALALWKEAARKVAISVAILPVAVMIDLCLPQGNPFGQAVVFYDTILLLTLVYRFMFTLDEPLKNSALKLRGYALALPMMAVIGQLLGALGYGLLRNHYAFKNISLPLVTASACVFALTEEMFFRGLVQQRAAKLMHPGMAAALSAILFTVMNIGYGTIYAPLYALCAGVVLSATYFFRQNLILTFTINAMSKLAYVGLLATFVLR